MRTSDGKSLQATATDRGMLPLKDPSDEPAPRSPPESLSASTETASPFSPPGDPYYETPVFNTPEYVDTPTPEQEPNQKRPDHYEETWTVSSDSSVQQLHKYLVFDPGYDQVRRRHSALNYLGLNQE